MTNKHEAKINRAAAATRNEKTYQGTPCKHGHSGVRDTLNGSCTVCQTAYYASKEVLHKKKLWRRGERRKQVRHGSTKPTRPMPDVCEWCGNPPEPHRFTLDLDHCHATGKFRAWLCGPCNRGLGAFKDNPLLLRKAADMLDAFNSNQECFMGRGIVSEDKAADEAYAKMEAEAKRYRFIRQFADPAFDDSKLPEMPEPVSVEHFDALVDAAMIGMEFKG